MTETQKRITAYKKALPHMKERVTAVALLLAIAITMMTSATFAWMTLSRSPEASSILTTVTTNGNLEIALSGKDGLQPADTTVNDGGRDIALTNLTWGNLINLSSESYGLSGITLRPATLNPNKLNTSPIYATQYGADGRVEGYMTDFAYTSYDSALKRYMVDKQMQYGVRGISSVTYEQVTGNLFLVNQLDTINKLYLKACSDFKTLYGNEAYMKVVYNLVQEYANISLGNDAKNISGTMGDLKEMMSQMLDVVSTLGQFYAEMANLTYYQTLTDAADYDPYDLQDVIDNKIPSKYTSHLKYYSKYRTLYSSTLSIYNGISAAATRAEKNEEVFWSDISTYANALCDMTKATVNGYTVSELKAKIKESPLGFGPQVAGWNVVPAVIHKGVMKDLDQFLAGDFYVPSNNNLAVSVTFIVSITLHPYVYTGAYQTTDLYAMADYAATENAASGGTNLKGEATAAETYAMAIDMWVRTNEDDALLILEGDYITETRTVTGEDADGNPVDLYLYTHMNGEEKVEVTLYKKNENGKDVWYGAESHEKVESVTVTADNPKLKTEEVVIGYGGVNRIWNELDDPNGAGSMIPAGTTSTTQGSGSCYVFYPASPEDQEQGKKLLAAMRVAFVSEDGTLLATAYMDTENAIEESGRVVVPLRLYANTAIEVEQTGKLEEYYVTRLQKNEATRITALIYLEGNGLNNSDVLSSGSITGQLNVQFGTNTMDMDPMDHNDLMSDYYSISKLQPACSADSPFTFAEGEQWELDVSMLIEGITPAKVTGNFVSVINATQGARQPEFELVRNPQTGRYEATVRFNMPGTYQLRSLQIDGVDYPLTEDNIVYVKVPGMGVGSLNWGDGTTGSTKTKLTADSFYNQALELHLGSDDGREHDVQGVFLGNNGKNVTVNFKHEQGTKYTGTATFNSSGIYEMTYLYVDGVITALDSSKYKTVDVSLGLVAEVRLTSPRFADGVPEADQQRILSELTFTPGVGYSFIYTGEQILYFDIVCTVKDDADNMITGAEDVMLYYGQGTTQNALSTILEWNGSAYVGTFDFQKYGIFNFSAVSVGQTNFITKMSSAHGITSIPADPMEYVGNSIVNDLVFALKGERRVSLTLENASAAKLQLMVKYEDGDNMTLTDYTVSNAGDASTFTFTLPKDGQWTIVGVKAGTVFYDNIFYSGADDDETTWLDLMPLMEAAGSKMSVKFITEAKVSLSVEGTNADGIFDLGEKTIGGTFTLPSSAAIKVTFLAYDGKNLAEHAAQAGKTLTATAEGTYGWSKNTIDVTSGTPESVTITGSASIGAQTSEMVLNVGSFTADGKWSLIDKKLTVTLDGTQYTLSGVPDVKTTWVKPTVTISAITPTNSNPTKLTWTESSGCNGTEPTFTATGNQTSSRTDYTATIYAVATVDNSTQKHGGFTRPTITLNVTGIDSASTVSLTLPGGSADAVVFTRTGNGTIKMTLGKVEQIKSWTSTLVLNHTLDAYYGHGNQTIRTMTVVRNGVTYSITLDNALVINNPSSENQT